MKTVKTEIEWHFLPEIPDNFKDLLICTNYEDLPISGSYDGLRFVTKNHVIDMFISNEDVYAWAYLPDKPIKL